MKKNLAFVFPGQGSQFPGMMVRLAEQFPTVLETFHEVSDVLGYDLWTLVQDGPQDKLNQTEYTQPALLTASVAAWQVWQASSTITPAFLAGHSLGEYSALVCAGAFSLADGAKLVQARGRAMQAAVPEGEGALAAILGLSDEAVIALCDEYSEGDVLSPANFNCPGQVVIAGTKAAVTRAISHAKAHGAKLATLLPVSVPSHSQLMLPAVERLKSVFDEVRFSEPLIPVINNVDVRINMSRDTVVDALLRQMTSPVQWVKTIQYLVDQGIDTIVECGPGKVLTGINKRINRSLQLTSFSDPDTLSETMVMLVGNEAARCD